MATLNKNKLNKELSANDLNLKSSSLLQKANETFNKNLENVPKPPTDSTKPLVATQETIQEEKSLPETKATTNQGSVANSSKQENTRISKDKQETDSQDEEKPNNKKRKRFISFEELISLSQNTKADYLVNNNVKLSGSNLNMLKTLTYNNRGTSVVSLVNIILEESFKYYQDEIAEALKRKQDEMFKMLNS